MSVFCAPLLNWQSGLTNRQKVDKGQEYWMAVMNTQALIWLLYWMFYKEFITIMHVHNQMGSSYSFPISRKATDSTWDCYVRGI